MAKSNNKIKSAFKQLDIFGVPVTLNADGYNTLNSINGAFFSIILAIFMLIMTVLQLQIWWYRQNVNIQLNTILDYFPSDHSFNLEENGQISAFGAFDPFTGEPKNDPEYVEWKIVRYTTNNGIFATEDFDVHVCNDTDYQKFYPVNQKLEPAFKKYFDGGGIYCRNDGTDSSIKGTFYEQGSAKFGYKLIPCQEDLSKNKTCTKTQEETEKYLEGAAVSIVYNTQRFDQKVFNDSKIVNETQIFITGIDSRSNTFLKTAIQVNQLQDSASRFNFLVPPENSYFYQFKTQNLLPEEATIWPDEYIFFENIIYLDDSLYTTERSVQNFLTTTGNLGGLWAVLQPLFFQLTASYSSLYASLFVVRKLFYVSEDQTQSKQKQKMNLSLNSSQKSSSNQLSDQFMEKYTKRQQMHNSLIIRTKHPLGGCCQSRSKARQRKKLNKQFEKALDQLTKEMDMLNIIKALRTFKIQLSGLLTQKQKTFSKILADEALSDFEAVSSQDSSDPGTHTQPSNNQMYHKWFNQRQVTMSQQDIEGSFNSKDPVDLRFVNLFKQRDDLNQMRQILLGDNYNMNLKEASLSNLAQNLQLRTAQPSQFSIDEIQSQFSDTKKQNDEFIPINSEFKPFVAQNLQTPQKTSSSEVKGQGYIKLKEKLSSQQRFKSNLSEVVADDRDKVALPTTVISAGKDATDVLEEPQVKIIKRGQTLNPQSIQISTGRRSSLLEMQSVAKDQHVEKNYLDDKAENAETKIDEDEMKGIEQEIDDLLNEEN